MHKNFSTMGFSTSDSVRVEHDLYETPEFFTKELLAKENFDPLILEPACGNGRISKILTEYGYNVYSTDLIQRNFTCEQKDFINDSFPINQYDIVTNPPYSLMGEFIHKASIVAKNKFAFVGKIQLLEGLSRYNTIYKDGINEFRLKNVYVSSRRLNFIAEKEFKSSSAMMICWFVFEKKYEGVAQLDWINVDNKFL